VEGALSETLEQRVVDVSLTNLLARQTHRSPYLLYPFYVMMFGSVFISTWGMCRMVLVSTDFLKSIGGFGTDDLAQGHKTWWYN
jgi:hypothetical protein